ncbi:hypothetical protein [Arthrospiribacter ruber]|uniref:Lipoprotein n=1 Tax=Arthrospiribacter ruber TaxID=2487934 RepID=A0A951MCU3_9BACT|nr:hypothetical protein [Arthrospiribacter ruber]MBW3468279.1 hypothetical protein [Arthrospiribacter ruber]
MKKLIIKNCLSIFVFLTILISCQELAEFDQSIKEDSSVESSEMLFLEPIENPNLTIMSMDWSCDDKCVTPNTTQAFKKRGESHLSFGQHMKKVNFILYNTFDQFVIEVNTSTSDFNFKGNFALRN